MAQSNQQNKRRGRRPSETITEAQRRTLDAIRDYVAQHSFAPTIKELSETLGLAMTPVNDSIGQLIRKGYLSRKRHTPRSLMVLREPEDEHAYIGEWVSIGLYGFVAAEHSLYAEENRLGEAMVPASVVAQHGTYFALRVQDDIMTDAGIMNGSTVVVRKRQLAKHGEIVVAAVDGEPTLRRLYWASGVIELRPENKKYKPIHLAPKAHLRIYGVVVETARVAGDLE